MKIESFKSLKTGHKKHLGKVEKLNGVVVERQVKLIKSLAATEELPVVIKLCKAETDWLDDQRLKPAARNAYIRSYRQSVGKYFGGRGIPQTLQVEKEVGVYTHAALEHLW